MVKQIFSIILVLLFFKFIYLKEIENYNHEEFQINSYLNSIYCINSNKIILNLEDNQNESDDIIYRACDHTSKDFNDFYIKNNECLDCNLPEVKKNEANYTNCKEV